MSEIDNIAAEIKAAELAEPELAAINSSSIVGVWITWRNVIASCIWAFKQLFVLFKSEIDETIKNQKVGSIPWYHSIVLAFQYGDDLAFINDEFKYASIDASKQIITHCAVAENGNQLRIKIASNGAPLNTTQLAAFSYYINKRKFAGTNLAIINYDADVVNITLKVYFNAMLMANDGTLISDGSKPVEDAVASYLANIKFGGVFNKTTLCDQLQSASGVIDPIVDFVEAKAANASSWTTVDHSYEAVSGYFTIGSLTIQYLQ